MYKYVKEGNNLYLLVEHGDYSLFDKLRQKKFFSEIETCYYISQTIKALRYMHERGVIHRDIKPENIVLINNVVKLADFGWSVYLDNKQLYIYSVRKERPSVGHWTMFLRKL